MTFILWSEYDEARVAAALGLSEYSYFFVLKGMRAALDALGETVVVRTVAEGDALAAARAASGRQSLFLCFGPPHTAPLALTCPVVCVFAWEYGTVPAEMLTEDPRSDWRTVFARHGRAITLSEHAANTVRAVMGPDFPIAVVPVPLPDRYFAIARPSRPRAVTVRGTVFDSRSYGPWFERPHWPPPAPPPAPEPPPSRAARHRALRLYRSGVRPHLPPRFVRALAGAGQRYARLRAGPPLSPASPPEPLREPEHRVELDGVVYASVFNPMDGRKNWQDMLTAFCWAFRDRPDATLVLKMVHHHRDAFEILLNILTRALQPFRCRIVALHGWMDDAEYEALAAAADFYVNTSACEGLCLPLLEFMGAGCPAVAPDHTAMADYVDGTNAFRLRYGIEHTPWPHDPRVLFRTTRHRLEWDSITDAFRESYRVRNADGARYAAMAAAAREAVRRTASLPVVQDRLRSALAA